MNFKDDLAAVRLSEDREWLEAIVSSTFIDRVRKVLKQQEEKIQAARERLKELEVDQPSQNQPQ